LGKRGKRHFLGTIGSEILRSRKISADLLSLEKHRIHQKKSSGLREGNRECRHHLALGDARMEVGACKDVGSGSGERNSTQ